MQCVVNRGEGERAAVGAVEGLLAGELQLGQANQTSGCGPRALGAAHVAVTPVPSTTALIDDVNACNNVCKLYSPISMHVRTLEMYHQEVDAFGSGRLRGTLHNYQPLRLAVFAHRRDHSPGNARQKKPSRALVSKLQGQMIDSPMSDQ